MNFDQTMKAYYKERDQLGIGKQMKEHPEDICECGDYRKDHPDDGACNLNGLGHNVPDYKCEKFRLAMRDEQPTESEGTK